MTSIYSYLKSLLVCGLLFISGWMYSQSVNWSDTFPETVVFKLTNQEALRLCKGEFKQKDWDKVQQTPFTRFANTWDEQPAAGHFLLATVEGNEVHSKYTSVIPFQVFIFKEYGKLSLQVIDSIGEVRRDAKVCVNGRRINYEKETQTYTTSNHSRKEDHILTVELDKFRAVFDLTKNLVEPWKGRHSYGNKPDFYSYLITDKNQYKPGETVRFKSYALSRHKKALTEELFLWMREHKGISMRKILSVTPYHPGGYTGEFQLMDSLELELNRSCHFMLIDAKGRIVASTGFYYEDYELGTDKLEVTLDSNKQYFPAGNRLNIHATDVNGLPSRGTNVEVVISCKQVMKSYAELLMLPDTLMVTHVGLDASGKASVNIPSNLFGASDCIYNVKVVLLTADNQRLEQQCEATYYHSCYEVRASTQVDTLCLSLFDLGVESSAEATLHYGDKNMKKVHIPYKEPFKQSIVGYWVDVPEIGYKAYIASSELDPKLELIGGIENDSLCISLSNPLQLEFSWYVHQGKKLLEKGSGTRMEYRNGNLDPSAVYYVEIFYILGNKEFELKRTYTVPSKHLSIESNLPERVYPGQKVAATLNVTNAQGQPVPDVDLTAFSFNNQLNYDVPDLKSFDKAPRTREQRATFSMDNLGYSHSSVLNYQHWNSLLHLDQMLYYQFAYPGGKMFLHTEETPDGTTQFAPYVMMEGSAVNIYVIEQNDIPCYFSWTEQVKGYSFLARCQKGKQKITLRMADRAFVIDSIAFEPGKKTILSFDMKQVPEGVKVIWLNKKNKQKQYEFTDVEKKRYEQFICRLPVQKDSDYTCLRQDGNLIPVSLKGLTSAYMKEILAGPVEPGIWQNMEGISYKHEGGFSYKFEGNVVYKNKDDNLCPKALFFSSLPKVTTLTNFNLTPATFNDLLANSREQNAWYPSQIYFSLADKKLNFRLPEEKDSTGVASLLFRDCRTGKLVLPDASIPKHKTYSHLPEGLYDVILLYNNGKYLQRDCLAIKNYTYLDVSMEHLSLHDSDSLSIQWLRQDQYVNVEGSKLRNINNVKFKKSVIKKYGNIVCGYVTDLSGEPMIGANVEVLGKQKGTITNIDGYFELDCEAREMLRFTYIGYEPEMVQATLGMDIFVALKEMEDSVLDEVVVTGYGTVTGVLAGAVPGVIAKQHLPSKAYTPLEEIEKEDREETGVDTELLYNELMQLNGLRRNFSDVAFWQPRLYTDSIGQAQFEVTFPDNVTKWEAIVYGMNRKLQTGTFRRSIRSYKSLMAELKTPRFLVEGDESGLIGTIRNYMEGQQIKGQAIFSVGKDTLRHREVNLDEGFHEALPIQAANTDSMTMSYLFVRDDGYRDGEEHTIPVLPQGTELLQGTLGILSNEEPICVQAGENEELSVSITNSPLDMYKESVSYLTGYKYMCNEQLASKLIGLLASKLYMNYEGKLLKVDKEIRSIVRRLLDNRNNQKLWSWWGKSESTSYWMSAHVLQALKMAEENGFSFYIDFRGLYENYDREYPYRGMKFEDLEVLHALSDWKVPMNYSSVVNLFMPLVRKLEQKEDSLARKDEKYRPVSFLKEKLLLWEMKQRADSVSMADSLRFYLNEDMLGGIYCSDGRRTKYWEGDNLVNTLIAYRMVKNDSTLSDLKEKMQLYILRTRKHGWNTYQASSAVVTVLTDLLADSKKGTKTTLSVHGKENKQISEFPYQIRLEAGDSLTIAKIGSEPLLYSTYSVQQVIKARETDAFKIESSLENDTLAAGIPATLTVILQVKQEGARYVMLDIPIPAGCSYTSKLVSGSALEVHREYFKERTVIFSEYLPIGTHKFNIPLLPRYSGKYTLNPAKAELMYFPVVNANNDGKKVYVIEKNVEK